MKSRTDGQVNGKDATAVPGSGYAEKMYYGIGVRRIICLACIHTQSAAVVLCVCML